MKSSNNNNKEEEKFKFLKNNKEDLEIQKNENNEKKGKQVIHSIKKKCFLFALHLSFFKDSITF